ncbi:hypothetical protein [Streptomyces asiaticus]|uniref:hypothetical protein n=1 Tax=Streptomyces asiaticus TaxID=114695 RepID=UPI003820274D
MTFTDLSEPTSHLTAPKAPSEFTNPLKPLNDASDLISPTYWVNEILSMALGFNPKEKAQEYFAGDWEEYSKCSEAWGNLAKLCSEVSKNIDSGNKFLDKTWDGNAADAAYAYFKNIAEKCDELHSELNALKDEYFVIAEGVWSTAEVVGTILSQIGDLAATAAISAAAGTLLSFTGWGAAVGYGLAATQILQIIEEWGKLTKTVNDFQLVFHLGMATLGTIGGGIATKFAEFPLPKNPYDNPVVN